ncbi:MAG: hypothetical protein H8Z69_05180 [Nanohaloarchaea archaeon]|nr:hypothetical protein [Candidatus Nanohaloarchaea archaeon]
MKLPWNTEELEERIEELEQKLEEEKQDKESWRNRFKAEEERRKELSRKKQEAEEELNRLKDKQDKDNEVEEEEEEWDGTFENLDYNSARRLLEKLSTIESGGGELVSIYSPGKLEDHRDLRSIKNSITKNQYSRIQGENGFVAFIDEELGSFILKVAPFYPEKFSIEEKFDVEPIMEFFKRKKYFTLVSAGETYIYTEKGGGFEEVEVLKSRIDREHGKGGFSQGRFEKKREEQIESHLNEIRQVLEGLEGEVYLRGQRDLSKKLPGKFVGGFDPNRSILERFYGLQLGRSN